MDVTTGKIKEFKSERELAKAQMDGRWVELGRRPNPGCKRCHGRGHLGRDVTTNEYVPCKCVKARPVRPETVNQARHSADEAVERLEQVLKHSWDSDKCKSNEKE